ncbi:hypothetical protein C8Q72DRAFT_320240 [Fomitopsis betulina]|nr:hypothetical protein C8Q72DRAFT_320240 [Fomitopsis betulina]
MACDILVVMITWRTTSRNVKSRLHNRGIGYKLSWFLLRDGTAYFLFILALNTIDLIVFFVNMSQDIDILATTVTIPVSMLLLARLLLNLREAVDQPGSTTESSGFLDTLHSSSRHMSLMLVNEIARDDTALTGIRGYMTC